MFRAAWHCNVYDCHIAKKYEAHLCRFHGYHMVSINGITVATIEYNVDHCGVPVAEQIYIIGVNITYYYGVHLTSILTLFMCLRRPLCVRKLNVEYQYIIL